MDRPLSFSESFLSIVGQTVHSYMNCGLVRLRTEIEIDLFNQIKETVEKMINKYPILSMTTVRDDNDGLLHWKKEISPVIGKSCQIEEIKFDGLKFKSIDEQLEQLLSIHMNENLKVRFILFYYFAFKENKT